MNLVEITDQQVWDEFVAGHPWGHPLQLWGWGEAKRGNGWEPHRLALMGGGRMVGGVQVLRWRLPKLQQRIVYAPRGPVAEPGSPVAAELLSALTDWAKQHQGLYVRIEPAWMTGAPKGWKLARNHIQLPETYTIDLRKSEEDLLAPMSHKHRQYIRKAARDGVTVAQLPEGEIGAMYALYQETAARAGFGIHPEEYYRTLSRELGENSYLYEAQFEGQPVAFLWLAGAGRTAYELYGGVGTVGGEMKANYAMKWEAMRAMKARGYEIYDFNGRLNEGVSRFKDGFGPDPTDYIGTYDYPLNTAGYHAWETLWPVAKRVGRSLRAKK